MVGVSSPSVAVTLLGDRTVLFVALLVAALLVGLALVVVFALTMGRSLFRAAQTARRERVEDALADELLDRLFAPDPDWAEWVSELSSIERGVVESLLDEHLRELDGAEAGTLRALGDALDIPERSQRRLGRGDRYDRLHALTWLTLLRRPAAYTAADFEPRTPDERATAARLLYESDALSGPGEGLHLLLDGATAPFSVFGQDTLYRIARDDPAALLDIAAAQSETWSAPLLVQVLDVCRELETSISTADLSWVFDALESDTEQVRVAAARALASLGWREDVHDDAMVARLLDDPSPRVRGATYDMLAAWGDRAAVDALAGAVERESDPRALVRGTDALYTRRDTVGDGASGRLNESWAWSRVHAEYDDIARHGGDTVSG